jgi:purine-nucleoside phosphorylase
MKLVDKVKGSAKYLSKEYNGNTKIAIILGTGLSALRDEIIPEMVISYEDIPHFPLSTTDSHQGELIYGTLNGVEVIMLSGRFHYYEGYSTKKLTLPIRVLKKLGIETIILTNASGAVNPHFDEGDIILITDHINFTPENPLRGFNDSTLGLRFPDMMEAYNPELQSFAKQSAKENNIKLTEGVYFGLQGPNLETPAEYRMARILGGDIIGMSTVPEVIVSVHSGIKVLAMSVVSNVCFPKSRISKTTVQDVIRTVNNASTKMAQIVKGVVVKIGNK